MSAHDVAFDLGVDQDDDDASSFSPSQYLAAESADPSERLEAEEWDTYTRERFQDAMEGLDAVAVTFLPVVGWRKRKPPCMSWQTNTAYLLSVFASWKMLPSTNCG